MTILFVMNGPFNFRSPTQWSVDEIAGEANSQKRRIKGAEDEEENSGNSQGSSARRSQKKARRSIEE